jgi:hypothetical protein
MRKITLVVAVWLVSLGALHAQEKMKPLGKWERKVGKSHVTLIVEEDRLHVIVLDGKACTVHADYSATKDGIIYGVVTSVESDEEEGDDEKSILDAPFSCRFRIDEGALIIRDLKCLVMGKDDMWNGRFKAAAPATTRGTTSLPPLAPPSANSSRSSINTSPIGWGISR